MLQEGRALPDYNGDDPFVETLLDWSEQNNKNKEENVK